MVGIIPLREKKGNYNAIVALLTCLLIIPLREKKGNYNRNTQSIRKKNIIPLREKKGNYNCAAVFFFHITGKKFALMRRLWYHEWNYYREIVPEFQGFTD